MPFFYRSHTSRHHVIEHIKLFCYAVLFATPTPFVSLVKYSRLFHDVLFKRIQAIGESDTHKKRAVPSASFSGSLTVEAALVLPLFLAAVLLLAGLFQAMAVCEQVNSQLCMTGRQMAAYSEAYDGSSLAEAYQLFYREIGSSSIEEESITGGYAGIILSISEDESSGLLELGAFYRIKVPGFFMKSQGIAVTDRIYVRPWTGGQPAGGAQSDQPDDSTLVYVAENGVVYHTSDECTYLQLSIHQCTLSAVDSLRNRYGAKYIPCELCGETSGDQKIYITDTGRAWHSDGQCSGLKRELHTISLEDAEEQGLRPCSRCGGH